MNARSPADVSTRYYETDTERVLRFEREGRVAIVAQNREGYAMLAVRTGEGDERERYYGLDIALDHAAEILGTRTSALSVPDEAADMGM